MSASASESMLLPLPESEDSGGAVQGGGMRGRDSSTTIQSRVRLEHGPPGCLSRAARGDQQRSQAIGDHRPGRGGRLSHPFPGLGPFRTGTGFGRTSPPAPGKALDRPHAFPQISSSSCIPILGMALPPSQKPDSSSPSPQAIFTRSHQ